MQRYQSHKIVEAGKLAVFAPGPDRYIVRVDDEQIELTTEVGLRIVKAMGASLDGKGDDLGYLVKYDAGTDDEYFSWSPSKQFEAGNDLVQPSSGKSKIVGYRELDESEIANMNLVKEHGKMLGVLVEVLRANPEHDQRWVSIAATELQQGLMALTRAIARPEFF